MYRKTPLLGRQGPPHVKLADGTQPIRRNMESGCHVNSLRAPGCVFVPTLSLPSAAIPAIGYLPKRALPLRLCANSNTPILRNSPACITQRVLRWSCIDAPILSGPAQLFHIDRRMPLRTQTTAAHRSARSCVAVPYRLRYLSEVFNPMALLPNRGPGEGQDEGC